MINSICGGVRMNFSLVTIIDEDLNQYKADMQEAFQKGFEDVFGKTEDIILPEKDIDNSLNQKNSVAYKAVVDGEMVGGAVVVIDEKLSTIILIFFMLSVALVVKVLVRQCGMKLKDCILKQRYGKLAPHILRKETFIFM